MAGAGPCAGLYVGPHAVNCRCACGILEPAQPVCGNYRMPPSYSTDIVIFGGGVAGLWLLNRLTAEGYQAILLERDRLGGGQSINSQGIIHGGLKFALHGALGDASRATADMPQRWRDSIEGHGEIDLSACRVLSPHFLLWSGAGMGAGMKAFLGSKAIAGKTAQAAPDEIPEILRGRGAVYRLPDFVLDSSSLIEALSAPQRNRIQRVDADSSQFIHLGDKRNLRVRIDEEPVEIQARRYVFCAGEGNEKLIEQAGLTRPPGCQLRPLKMVSVSSSTLPPLFTHVLGEGLAANPALTVTSHRNAEDEPVWYLGGELAEAGAARSEEEQEETAKGLLRKLFPNLEIDDMHWRCLDINRAEPASARGRRPDNAAIASEDDIIVAWPTKLTLAPALADIVLQHLRDEGITPEQHPDSLPDGPSPPHGRPFWS
ncbi:MAG: FAD-dependent oxidoreductase [Gammaproteobacteria bacterium]|nr:FAD-dependent oxidoreductase [Gammaproteobacteria bacterium]MXZ32741.1 FAD-dependent oxidoreductase [Gammaproteobacteria bacterium]MYE98642.1 FAD-dependent oxidoreductase [Gammaproteobacteria bacterium]MYG95367.1 FAD-dependent oxidoreductase [Gammaproteobacteria bacterium]